MFRSIRGRLVISYMLITLLTAGALGFLAQWGVQRYAEQQEAASLSANAESIARQALPLIKPVIARNKLNQLAQAAAVFGNMRVRIFDQNHKLIIDTGMPDQNETITWFVFPEEFSNLIAEQTLRGWIIRLPRSPQHWPEKKAYFPFLEDLPFDTPLTIVQRIEGPWGNQLEIRNTTWQEAFPRLNQPPDVGAVARSKRTITVPIGDPRNPLGYVELSGGTNFRGEALATTRRALLFAGIGALALAGVVGLAMGNRLSKPITSLTETTRQMSAGDLSVRAHARGKDEIGQLAEQFNLMAARLQASFDQLATERDTLRRFIDDASHELRTPITALHNFNELLLGSAEDDAAARREFLVESQIQIDRLAWITDNLLDLSRLDGGISSLELSKHPLGSLIQAALAPYRARATEKGIRLLVDIAEPATTLICDRGRVESALGNLIDNALKFTPAGGEVRLSARTLADQIVIQVCDSGPGIDPQDLPHVFERFYRGRNTRTEGSGLGLAIVQSVVQAHGGRVKAESEPGEGSCFTLELPRTPPRV